MQGLVSTAREQVLKLITTDWLVPEGETSSASHSMMPFFPCTYSLGNKHPAADRRVRELARIRQLFVPELILRLHTLLVSSRAHLPECVVISVPHLIRSLIPLYQQCPARLVPSEYRRRLEVHVVHRVCGGERTQVKGVPCCRAHRCACRVRTWRIRFVQGCALNVFLLFYVTIGPLVQPWLLDSDVIRPLQVTVSQEFLATTPGLIFTHISLCLSLNLRNLLAHVEMSRLSGP